jgi:glycosyltransferase involved in cell wall biosynthesis
MKKGENILSQPRFTVIIPVRNRSPYLYQTLRTCSSQDYDNLEIIVSDDYSTDDSKEMVEAFIKLDPRIKYLRPSEVENVGMLDNFEFALNHVQEGYVIALGGDDGLMPNSISKMLEILQDTNREILCWPTDAYFYPCQKVKNGQLVLQAKGFSKEEEYKIIDSKTFLLRQSDHLFYISDVESPMIYVKGVISTKVIDRVKSRSMDGKFYKCSTPDGYSGIVVAGEVNDWVFYNKPLSIHGVSPTSQGLGYLTKSDDAKQHSESFFKKAISIPMHPDLASQNYSPLITIMTADFLLTARDLPGWPGSIAPIEYKKLIVNSIKELQDGLYPEDRLSREIEIIKNIAIRHNLLKFFEEVLKKSYRNGRIPLEGNAISPRLLYLDAKDFKVNNVFEASFFIQSTRNIYPKVGMKLIVSMFVNSLRYRFFSFKKKSKLSNYV